MSLLMQALKKAENAKQKQGEAESAATTAQETLAPSSGLESLTLQPQEFSPQELADQASAATPDAEQAADSATAVNDYFSASIARPHEQTAAQQQAQLEADSGLTPKPRSEPSAASNTAAAELRQTTQAASARADDTHGKLKIGLDQKQSAAIEAKKKLAARNAAKSVFDAKQKSPNRRAIMIALFGVIVLCGVGAYGYMSLIGTTSNVIAVAPPVPEPVAPLAALPPDTAATAAATDATTAAAPVDSASIITEPAPAVASANAVTAPSPALPAAPLERSTAQPLAPQAVSHPIVTATAPAAPTALRPLPSAQPPLSSMSSQSEAIQIRRTNASLQLNPSLSGAYQAYTAGDLVSANSQYQRVLQQEPNNRDALLGIAAIAINRGQNAQAGSFYNRLLELDPNDAEAAAGLASLDQNDPSRAESRLKKVLAQSPNSGSALFALGNVYAQQMRWPEAQQFYFRAFGATPGNADYAYNLAVSLDKLNQGQLALDYYQRALQLSQKNGGNLDQTSVTNRIHALQSVPRS